MPDESAPHTRTWMAFGPTAEIWGADLVAEVQRNLADVANAIARFEPVSLLARPAEVALATRLTGEGVSVDEMDIDDLWVRDTGPVLVVGGAEFAGVDFNFNGWGGKQEHDADALVARQVLERAKVRRLSTELVLEAGRWRWTARARRSSPAVAS